MTTAPSEAPTPTMPEGGAREGRVPVVLPLGGAVVLFASYFAIWGDRYSPDPGFAQSPDYFGPFAPVTDIFPRQGFSLTAVLLLVAPAALSALFAFLTRRGSREARRLFATFSLMTGLFCLVISTGMLVLLWSDALPSHGIHIGGVVGWLASLLIFGVALSLSAALLGTASPSAPVPV